MSTGRKVALALGGATAVLLAGCIPLPMGNPAIAMSRAQASDLLARMRAKPVALRRPVVVLNGYHAPGPMVYYLAEQLRTSTSGRHEDFLAISYDTLGDIDRITDDVLRRVRERWPSEEPERTAEVDVVAISMGGLVARWAALEPADRQRAGPDARAVPARTIERVRLDIARLYTLGTPHRGARLARYIAIDPAARDMRPGSAFLDTVNKRLGEAEYELVCYGQQNDTWVGATRTSPPGRDPIWSGGTLLFSHFTTKQNPLFIADIASRLRGEGALLEPAGPPRTD